MALTREEYEQQYLDALEALRSQGKIVGAPYRIHDGVRAVHVDGLPCVDLLVFTAAWGIELAEDIQANRPG
jgi:hypothetical protein